uniref:RxLR effector candidate protein n=1 Tax=Hyaloperonospora arabidopsidis (strain Emoy2) TaxID=559515 RepID=M4BGU7_HYAAE
MNEPRVPVTQEMYEGIANLQSLYKRAGRSFPDGPSSASDAPFHTARQGPKHQLAVESEAPKYMPMVNTRATGRGNSSDIPSHRGGSTGVPRGSIGHRAHQSMDEAEEEIRSQTGLQVQSDTVSQLERVTCEFREDFEHERSIRLGLVDNVTRLSSERERDRSDFAFAQLENERAQRSLRDELVEARQDISWLRGEISELQTRADSIIWRCSSARDFFTGRSLVQVIRPKTTDVERRMCAHLTWQFNCICVA